MSQENLKGHSISGSQDSAISEMVAYPDNPTALSASALLWYPFT